MIAALADVLVVVESRASGGSMHTVEAAIRRSVQVLAVPGAPGAPASIGTNRLIAEGCAPCVDATDVLVALGLSHSPTKLLSPESTGASGDLLQLLAQGPLTLDQIVSQSGLDLVTAVRYLGGLEVQGFVAHEGGWWQATAVITMGGTKM
jgi:DNA processing protein